MAVDAKLVLQYRNATEALLDALTVFEAKIHTRDGAEYNRLERLVVGPFEHRFGKDALSFPEQPKRAPK